MSCDEKTPIVMWEDLEGIDNRKRVPGLLVAYNPQEVWLPADRIEVPSRGKLLIIGRSRDASWTIVDRRLSKKHVELFFDEEKESLLLRDLGSTNGTFVGGMRLEPMATHEVKSGEVIAIGRLVLVFHSEISGLLEERTGRIPEELVGRFHAPVLFRHCEEAAATGLHVLLSGESGTGKELVARALASMYGNAKVEKMVAVNAARFANDEEAATSLFGVESGVFSGVAARSGMIAEAEGKTLLIDEVHEFTLRTQRALLRFIEDGVYGRIGSDSKRDLQLKIVLGTNLDVKKAVKNHRLAFDLVNRLGRLHVSAARERRADIPDIFLYHLEKTLREPAFEQLVEAQCPQEAVSAHHIEAICLLDLEEKNLRELVHLAKMCVARAKQRKVPVKEALTTLLLEMYKENNVVKRIVGRGEGIYGRGRKRRGWGRSGYERNRTTIVTIFHENGENVSATVRELKERGIEVSRRWLSHYLEEWGEK